MLQCTITAKCSSKSSTAQSFISSYWISINFENINQPAASSVLRTLRREDENENRKIYNMKTNILKIANAVYTTRFSFSFDRLFSSTFFSSCRCRNGRRQWSRAYVRRTYIVIAYVCVSILCTGFDHFNRVCSPKVITITSYYSCHRDYYRYRRMIENWTIVMPLPLYSMHASNMNKQKSNSIFEH